MKFDRRLARRKDWISRNELEKRVEALPDVSHKIASDDESPTDSPTDSEEGNTPEPASGSEGLLN